MKYVQLFIKIFKQHYQTVFLLGLTYASVSTFPIFGPVLLHITEPKYYLLISFWSLFFLTLGFLIKPFSLEKRKNFYLLLCLASSFFTVLFFFLPLPLQFLAAALLCFSAGRITVYWSKIMFADVAFDNRAKVISLALFVAFIFLYLANALSPSLPKPLAPLFSALLILSSTRFLRRNSPVPEPAASSAQEKKLPIPWNLFFLIVLIYIPAGLTFTEVYPELTRYDLLERFYNVLPFMLAVNIAGYLGDAWGRKYPLFIGISLLGLSFVFFLFEPGILTYFLIQSTIQIAWSFLDLYVWVVTADIAENNNRREYYTYGLGAFTAGTLGGSILHVISVNSAINPTLQRVLAYLPLFVAVVFLTRIPETLKRPELNLGIFLPSDEIMETVFAVMKDRYKLTPRELEVAFLILQGLSNVQISQNLYISENTVKYHMKNIFLKTGISNRHELKNCILNLTATETQ